MIFPALFSAGYEPQSSVGLVFLTVPLVFDSMPLGRLMGTLFFFGFYIAAVTSSAGVMEAVVGMLMDQFKLTRKKALLFTVLFQIVIGKGVEFVSKKEAIDTTTPTGKFMLTVFGAVAELEREYILQRQREGIAIAKTNGVYKGRKPIQPPDFEKVMARWQRREITAAEAMRQMGMSKSTFYRKARGQRSLP